MEVEFDITTPTRSVSRKRQLDRDDYAEEETDSFDFDDVRPMRRGRKEGRRVSGVYREIKDLHNIGKDVQVMELVMSRMTTKDVLLAGCVCPTWLIIAYRVLRKRLGNQAFLRLHHNCCPSQELWVSWELHYHEELLTGTEDEITDSDRTDQSLKSFVPGIQAIISVGNKNSHEQLIHRDAKLPFRQDFVYAICRNAIITAPNYSFVDTICSKFDSGTAVLESIFIPKSENFTMKGFGLEWEHDFWTIEDTREKVKVYEEDLGGSDQKLTALLLIKYMDNEKIRSFVESFGTHYNSASILEGDAEDIGCNRMKITDDASAVGYAIYTGAGATATIYEIDFLKDNANSILQLMKDQVDSHTNNFCFMFYRDARQLIECKDKDADDEWGDWSKTYHPEPIMEEVTSRVREALPSTPFVGIKSLHPFKTKVDNRSSNIQGQSSNSFTAAFLLLTYL